MKNETANLNSAIDYLGEFVRDGYLIEFDTPSDPDIVAVRPDSHIHRYWELKFRRDGHNLLNVHPPNTVHCESKSDLVIAATFQYLRIFDRNLEFTEDNIRGNLLPELLRLLKDMPGDKEFDKIRHELSIAVVINILLLITRYWQTAERQWQNKTITEIALDYMENHYFQSNLSVVDIARFIGVSPQTLNADFRRNTGLSTRQNLVRIRLNHALELLNESKYMVKDVAALTGWNSAFYFCNTFRSHFGRPPRG